MMVYRYLQRIFRRVCIPVSTLKQQFLADPQNNGLRHELHERGYWVTSNFDIVHVEEMGNEHLVNTLNFNAKLVDALIQAQVESIMVRSAPMLSGEFARMSVEPNIVDLLGSSIPTRREALAALPIIRHLWLEIKRRELTDRITTALQGDLE